MNGRCARAWARFAGGFLAVLTSAGCSSTPPGLPIGTEAVVQLPVLNTGPQVDGSYVKELSVGMHVRPTSVRQGSPMDLADAVVRPWRPGVVPSGGTPYYVDVSVSMDLPGYNANAEGMEAVDSDGERTGAVTVTERGAPHTGVFGPCTNPTMAENDETANSRDQCLVFIVPPDADLAELSIDGARWQVK